MMDGNEERERPTRTRGTVLTYEAPYDESKLSAAAGGEDANELTMNDQRQLLETSIVDVMVAVPARVRGPASGERSEQRRC